MKSYFYSQQVAHSHAINSPSGHGSGTSLKSSNYVVHLFTRIMQTATDY